MTRSTARRMSHTLMALAMLATIALFAPADSAVTSALTPAAQAAGYPRHGQRGAAVRSVQWRLVEAGFLRAQYRTGYFGDRTRSAVRRLQARYDLPVTGRLSRRTNAALDKAVAAMTGPRTWYHKETIGRSQSNRPIVAYRAGERGKPVVMVVATVHGEEDFGQYVARGLLEGRKIKGVDLWVVPVLNPDGLAKDRRWVNGHVDLNRNFPTGWTKRANTGPRPRSERETRVIMSFLRRTRPRYLVSWHQPLFGVDSDRVKDRALMRRLSKGLDIPLRKLDCGGRCHGTMTGWYNATFAGAAITVEYGSRARTMKRMKGADASAVLAAIGGRR